MQVYPPATPSPAFSLGLTTGVLVPASILNFELLPVYDVRVTLTDNGSPPLATAITLRVNILDRNDKCVGVGRRWVVVEFVGSQHDGLSDVTAAESDP